MLWQGFEVGNLPDPSKRMVIGSATSPRQCDERYFTSPTMRASPQGCFRSFTSGYQLFTLRNEIEYQNFESDPELFDELLNTGLNNFGMQVAP
jgi:hypothetical protein